MSDSLALFRTCKSLQAEAAASLYGQNVFSFDNPCFWAGRARPTQNSCGVTSMSAFLTLIGPLNRSSIGHIRIHINRATYFHYKGEFNNSPTGHARFLGDAFDLLSAQGHSLRQLELRVTARCVTRFLRPIRQSLLLRKLRKLSGGLEFKLSQEDGEPWDLNDFVQPHDGSLLYKHLQECLAGPRPVRTFGSPIEKQAHAISTEVVVISNRYGGLQKSVKAAEKQMQEWTGDESWTQMMNVLVRGWKEEMRKIEDGLGSMEGTVGTILRNKALGNESSNQIQHSQRLNGTANERLVNNIIRNEYAHHQDTQIHQGLQNHRGLPNQASNGTAGRFHVDIAPDNQRWHQGLGHLAVSGSADGLPVNRRHQKQRRSQHPRNQGLNGSGNGTARDLLMHNDPGNQRLSSNPQQIQWFNGAIGGVVADTAVNDNPGNQCWSPNLQNQGPSGTAHGFLMDNIPRNGPPSQTLQNEDLNGAADLFQWDQNWNGFY